MNTKLLNELKTLNETNAVLKERFPKVMKMRDTIWSKFDNIIPIVFYGQLPGVEFCSEVVQSFAGFVKQLEQLDTTEMQARILDCIAKTTIKIAHNIISRNVFYNHCCGNVELVNLYASSESVRQMCAIIVGICDTSDYDNDSPKRKDLDRILADAMCSKMTEARALIEPLAIAAINLSCEQLTPNDAIAVLSNDKSTVFIKNQRPFEMMRLVYETPSLVYKLAHLPIDNIIITRPNEFNLAWYTNEYSTRSNKTYDIVSFSIDAQLTCMSQFYPNDSEDLCPVFIMCTPEYSSASAFQDVTSMVVTLVVGCVDNLDIMNNVGNIIDALYETLCDQDTSYSNMSTNYYRYHEKF